MAHRRSRRLFALGRLTWKVLIGNALLVTLTLVAASVLITREVASAGGGLSAEWPSLVRLLLEIVGVAVVATVLLALGLVRLWTRPLRQIIRTARSLSRGDLSARADASGNDELAVLARALNRMRDRLVRNYKTIDRQRRTLELLLQQLREGVVVSDADGRLLLVNPAAVRLLNLQTADNGQDLVGKAVERCIVQHDLQVLLIPSPPTGRPGSPPTDSHLAEARVQIDGDEGVRHLLAHASDLVLFDTEGDSSTGNVGRLLVLTDVTALTRAIEIKTDFVANASHELRTPLSTIRAAVETLQRMTLATDAESAERFIGVIERQSGRLEALASDLLELARLESSPHRFPPRRISLNETLEDLRQSFADRVAAKGLSWQVDRAACPHEALYVNPHLLRLILDNLVDNAVKFTEPDGQVRIVLTARPGWVDFGVEDTGCGIAEEDRQRVFERFYQVERARSGHERGTGLGLAIVRHAVAALGGELELESEPGRGTRVSVSLPIGRAAAPLVGGASGNAG
jgi:two-component system phosphate regulon sensor histidine kinase PhoR